MKQKVLTFDQPNLYMTPSPYSPIRLFKDNENVKNMSVTKRKQASTKSSPGKPTKSGPGNVIKCATKKTAGIYTIAAAGAVIAVMVISMVALMPKTTTINVNMTISQSFYVKTWNGTTYVTNSSWYPDELGLVVLVFDGKFIQAIDDEFASNSSAIITPSVLNKTMGSGGLVELTMPAFFTTPGNVSIQGKSITIPFSSDSLLLVAVLVSVNDDAVGNHQISGGLEPEFKFVDAITHGLNKTTYDDLYPRLFRGSVDITALGGYYQSSMIKGINATVNGVAMAFESKYMFL